MTYSPFGLTFTRSRIRSRCLQRGWHTHSGSERGLHSVAPIPRRCRATRLGSWPSPNVNQARKGDLGVPTDPYATETHSRLRSPSRFACSPSDDATRHPSIPTRRRAEGVFIRTRRSAVNRPLTVSWYATGVCSVCRMAGPVPVAPVCPVETGRRGRAGCPGWQLHTFLLGGWAL